MWFSDNTIFAGGFVNTYPTKKLSFGEDEAGMAKLPEEGGGGEMIPQHHIYAGSLKFVNNYILCVSVCHFDDFDLFFPSQEKYMS